jgi:hypothetical protein
MPRAVTQTPPSQRDLKLALGIFVAALAARVAYLALKGPLLTPDGSYYYAVARSLAAGRGFVIGYVWHYLMGIPAHLPAPSNDYWMPLSSVLQAGALKVGGASALAAAAMPSVIAGAAVAAFVFWLTRELFGSARAGLLAAVMWIISAHFVALSASTDCFMLAALLTSLALYAIHRARGGDYPWAAAGGGLTGLAYLTRSDAAVIVVTAALMWVAANACGLVLGAASRLRRASAEVHPPQAGKLAAREPRIAGSEPVPSLCSEPALRNPKGQALSAAKRDPGAGDVPPVRGTAVNWRPMALYGAALVVVAAPWWVRNWLVLGAPLGAPVAKTAFLATYNDIFRLDCSSLSLRSYLALDQGFQGLMKGYVLWRELRLLAVMCGLALPFAIWAVLTHPRRNSLSPWLVYVALVVAVTAFVFPYPAVKGTFWHLAPSLCVFIFAAGASGIMDATQYLRRTGSRLGVLGALCLPALAVGPLLAWYAFTPSEGGGATSPYQRAAGEIRPLREPVRVALTDDAWGLNHFTGLRCAQVPSDGAGAALRVADTLGANYLFAQQRSLDSIRGVAAIRRCRRFEPVARWGRGPGAICVYHIMPFVRAERIAKSFNSQGRAFAAAGRFDDAINAFEAAESYKPDFAPIVANIALACWQAGRREQAYLRAAQALALDPTNRTAQMILRQPAR